MATSPHADGQDLFDFPLGKGPVALVFGTELTGISPDIIACADEFLTIPMYGFVESFNISVSVAICLSQLSTQMRNQNLDWQLRESENQDLLFQWLKSSIKKSDAIIANYYSERQL